MPAREWLMASVCRAVDRRRGCGSGRAVAGFESQRAPSLACRARGARPSRAVAESGAAGGRSTDLAARPAGLVAPAPSAAGT